jgi:RNA ligase (TIGR02306 family)
MLATIERIESIHPHPNADSLEFARVLGYDCIVRRGQHSAGDRVVFIQPDAMLPGDLAWAAEVVKYTKSGGRVRATRLRGEWSMGLVMPVAILGEDYDPGCDLGTEVCDELGIVPYEAPLPRDLKAKGALPFGIPKTDEDRHQNLGRNLERWIGEEVDVTLKIDGSSFTAYCALPGDHPGDDVATGVTSRTLDLKLLDDATNHWIEAARATNVLELLKGYCQRHQVSLALRGEVFGPGVQVLGHNPHCRLERGVAFFSVWNIRDRRYEGRGSRHYFARVCEELSLPAVPILEGGVPLSKEILAHYAKELEVEPGSGNPFEGVVIKGADFSFKVINYHYDAKK